MNDNDWRAQHAATMALPCDCDGLMRGTDAPIGPHTFGECPCRWFGPLHSKHAYWHMIWHKPAVGFAP
jgi:hypothetical protein